MWKKEKRKTNDNKKELVLKPSCCVEQPFRSDSHSSYLVGVEELPLSKNIKVQLKVWSGTFKATCDKRSISKFPSLEAYEAFDQEGFALWKAVRKELDSRYDVLYYSERLGGLFKHPDASMVMRIKLMPDYGCYPIWGVDEIGNIAPEKLPLKADTISRLNAWARLFDDGLDWSDPGGESLWSEEDAQLFEQEGINLWHQLRRELSPKYEVYFSSQSIKHPDELLLETPIKVSGNDRQNTLA